MPLWKAAPVDAQPEMHLLRWQVFETDHAGRHFIGWSQEERSGRVSSAILEYDPLQKRGKTLSGRIYQLEGPPGRDEDALYVWEHWHRVNGVTCVTDVTSEYSSVSGYPLLHADSRGSDLRSRDHRSPLRACSMASNERDRR